MKYLLASSATILSLLGSVAATGMEIAELPVLGSPAQPTMVLELGSAPALTKTRDARVRVTVGELSMHEGDASASTGPDEVTSRHPGFGTWNLAFRFRLKPPSGLGQANFWARWRQGGEPNVCVQAFDIWAGPEPSRLERRGTVRLKPKGWNYAWIAAQQPLEFKAGDAVVEIRVKGAGHDAKVFDAFMLAPLQAASRPPAAGGPGGPPETGMAVGSSTVKPAGGAMTSEKIQASAEPAPLRNGIPEAWLVGGLHDGLAGLSIYGLDSETVMRPNPGEKYFSTQLMGGEFRTWREAASDSAGVTVVEDKAPHSYAWSAGTGYAQLYLHADRASRILLRWRQSGMLTSGWLDGRPLEFAADSTSAPINAGGEFPADAEPPRRATLNLSPGWHRLLVKLVMRHTQGQRFFFAARFTDTESRPLDAIRTRVADPEADLGLNAAAAKLRPLIYVDAPANLPQSGDPLKVRADIRWHPLAKEKTLDAPLPSFEAVLQLRLTDYSGKQLAVRKIRGRFPAEITVDFGRTPEAGYYAVHPALYSPAGALIMAYPPDGFTVIRGAAAQRERLDEKKLWNNDYYALADGDRSFGQEGGYFSWLERMGIYRSYGAYPGFSSARQAKWELAKQRGLILFADSAGDSDWLNDKPEDGRKFIDALAPFTRYFKASNEIDTRREAKFQKLRDPEHWVRRAQWEYEYLHQVRPDAHYVGGSLVRPGDMARTQGYPDGLGPGRWFVEVLKLGLDKYQDAWDVHAYPRDPPRLGGPIGNSESEDERGVLAAYASLGRTNTLPFWLGETGAKAAYGHDGRRWQAEQAAKMIAWANSRRDYLGIAFCIAHEYDWGYGRLWDYSMGHKPGEAALYTAGALIDGLPYRSIDTRDPKVQAAWFGETFMIWRTDETDSEWRLSLDPSKSWLAVDVVGRARALSVGGDGAANITISASPAYVLPKAEYERLMRN